MKELGVLTAKQAEAKINFLPFNRGSNVRKSLVDSMTNYGFLNPVLLIQTNLITGVKDIFIADGQHRLKTALFLGKNISYKLCKHNFKTLNELVTFVSILNTTSHQWENKDYVDAYSYLGNKEYQVLNKYNQEYDYSLTILATLLNNNNRTNIKNIIRSGEFKIISKKDFLETMDISFKLSFYYKPNNRMLQALYKVKNSEKWNYNKFEKKYISYIKKESKLQLDDFYELFLSWL